CVSPTTRASSHRPLVSLLLYLTCRAIPGLPSFPTRRSSDLLDDLLAGAGDQHHPACVADDQRGRSVLDPRSGSEQLGRVTHRPLLPSPGVGRGRVSSSTSDSSCGLGALAGVPAEVSASPTTSTASTTTTLTLSR